MTECCVCEYVFFRGQTYSIDVDGKIYCAECLYKKKKELEK